MNTNGSFLFDLIKNRRPELSEDEVEIEAGLVSDYRREQVDWWTEADEKDRAFLYGQVLSDEALKLDKASIPGAGIYFRQKGKMDSDVIFVSVGDRPDNGMKKLSLWVSPNGEIKHDDYYTTEEVHHFEPRMSYPGTENMTIDLNTGRGHGVQGEDSHFGFKKLHEIGHKETGDDYYEGRRDDYPPDFANYVTQSMFACLSKTNISGLSA